MMYLSIHHNAGAGMSGFEVYISKDADAGIKSARMARIIHRNLKEEHLMPSSRGGDVLTHGFIPLLHRGYPGVLVEVEYLNASNASTLRSAQAQRLVVKALYESLCESADLKPSVDISKVNPHHLEIAEPTYSQNESPQRRHRRRHR